MSINKQILIGNLGKDPDVRTFPDGSKACRFPVAVTEKGYTLQNGTQVPEHTEWFNILCRAKKAEIAEQFLHKGDKVYIEGSTFTGEYTDQSGQKKRYTEVRCDVLELLTPKPQSQQGYIQQPAASQYVPGAPQYAPVATQFAQAPVQQPYAPAPANVQMPPQSPAPAQAPAQAPVGVFGQPAQVAPVDPKPW